MKNRTIGKIRGLQQSSTISCKFAILALDHRNNMRRLLHPENEQSTNAREIETFKNQVIAALAEIPSAYLLDPLYGAAQNITTGTLPGSRGLLVALEETGYSGDPMARKSRVLQDWSVEKIKRLGASAAKLLVYYHPQSKTHAQIEALVEETAEDCQKFDIPFFLEILTYPLNPSLKQLEGDERSQVIIASVEKLSSLDIDVLKVEFPVDIQKNPGFESWIGACESLSTACRVPWILLSASADFETFLRQVTAACMGGASGVAAGRAVWKEAATLAESERIQFLRSVAAARMSQIRDLVNALARPWSSFFEADDVNEKWYPGY